MLRHHGRRVSSYGRTHLKFLEHIRLSRHRFDSSHRNEQIPI
ncbi:hypothetical protein L810_3930 [Burkholderia sp. AU4i]|nr:hypothetical protein L810_3930 [Burkholderia sp. AU4i]